MGKQRAKPAGQKQLRVIAKHEESTADHVADATEQTQGSNNSWPYQHVDYSSPAAGNGALILQNYSLVVPCWSLSDAFCLHEPCLQAAAGSSSEQDRQLSCLPLLAQNGSRLDALLQDAYQPGSSLAGIVQLWREGRYRERTQLALQLAHHTPDTLLAEAAWAVMDLVPSTASGWVKRIKVAAAAAQWASQQLAQQGQLLPPEGVRDAQGAVKPEQAMWLRAMLLLARTVHAAEATSSVGGGHYSGSVPGDVASLLLRLLPDDMAGMRFLMMHMFSSRRQWERLMGLCECRLGDSLPPDSLTLAVAYNKALAAFHVLGGQHPDAHAAVAAALELDRCRWVPLLLGAGAMASPDLGPLLLLGSKQEATAYCHNYGMTWHIDSPRVSEWREGDEENHDHFDPGSPVPMGPSLTWLLEAAGLQQLQQPMEKDRVSALLLNTYVNEAAWRGVASEVVDQMNLSWGAGTARIIPPEARPRLLRCELVLLCSLAASTANLPPVDAGPAVWQGVAEMVGTDISRVKDRLVDCAKVVYDMTRQLLQTCQVQQGPWQGAWPGELAHAAVTLAELAPARIRWLWQAGEVRSRA
ncbi:hypothetical protein OEZ86_001620 [Tetradesmus obliquus]|nr:hypothetical protein OEZ86_001620 [Tetradesmus obliquus]